MPAFLQLEGSVIMKAMPWSRWLFASTLAGLCSCAPSQVTTSSAKPSTVQQRPASAPSAAAPARAPFQEPRPAPEALARARHVLNRFAFGPRPGEVERVARAGVEHWFDAQLAGPEESPLLEAALVPHRSAFEPPAELVSDWVGDDWQNMRTPQELRQELKPQFREHIQRLATAEVTRDILSQRQLEAVMTDFWANHFNVFAAKGFVRLFEGDYLERAIRPHALGRFSDLLLATARHPAMLLYLDNADSQKEAGEVGKPGRKRHKGVNENYARELLELHTLGVDGGYTQQDVENAARILTGWSVVRIGEHGFDYVFRRRAHDRGEKTVLGVQFPAGQDEAEGVRLLELLAQHPSTAKHLAGQLCARFVADEPPASCVSVASQTFLATGGDIKLVLRAIFDDASFWQARDNKLKTPLELVASAVRALGGTPDGSLGLAKTLTWLGEPLLQERVPTGYPDSEPEWASGGGMLVRMSFASELASGNSPGLALDLGRFAEVSKDADPARLVGELGDELLGLPPDSRTLQLIREEVAGIASADDRRTAAVALLLGSPEFQRQ